MLASAGAAIISLLPRAGEATPEALRDALAALVPNRTIKPGLIALDLPAIAETGHAVPLTITVSSP
ncbi:MAG: hypothetical protein FJX53_12080, partial [Alphaproteobacteria bacterium]|nr:hypothetical protein [Alphaproteobacteria bacterium]